MSLKCKIGLHSWAGCKCTECGKIRNVHHAWSRDCEKCSICGKTREDYHDWSIDCEKCSKCCNTRDQQHDWSKDCEKCSKCGKPRNEQHDWSKDCEKCSKCGKISDNHHDWSKDCEKCAKCGKTREKQHDWSKDCEKCSKCGKIIEEQHDWSKDCEKCSMCGKTKQYGHDWDENLVKCQFCGRINAKAFFDYIKNEGLVKYEFIEAGIDLEEINEYGFTALMVAVMLNKPTVVEELLKTGANPDTKSIFGDTALFYAVKECEVECLEALIKSSANLEEKNRDNYTALELACQTYEPYKFLPSFISDTIQILVKANAYTFRALVIARNNDALVSLIKNAIPKFDNMLNIKKENENAAMKSKPQGLIRYALLVASLPDKPEDSQMHTFLFDLLPELKKQPEDIATFGFLWENKPMNLINMQTLATSAFGDGILNMNKYIYRTLHIKLKTGEAKCFVVYDVDTN